ncbi:ARG1-like 1 [Actinidia rufa]|uniref:ARG1-like 1 n=1 Tax=Actinidia rufa TaxID=165716 RepID=A0A7J0GUL5_9ERIC|nr:ARG1-like 1 [Actinidia rufa]
MMVARSVESPQDASHMNSRYSGFRARVLVYVFKLERYASFYVFVRKVEKQCAHFYSVRIAEEEAQSGFVCRVQSSDKSKFKLLYFDQEENCGLSLALQEDSAKTRNVTSAGMYFLGFPVYRLDQVAKSMAAAKDPDTAFFKKLDGFQPCEITELKTGTHVFAVYGDNFFKSASYSIEALCAAPFTEEKENLRSVETQILYKRVELSKFETEYREVLQQFTEMTSRYAQEMQAIDELLKERNEVHASYTVAPPMKRSSSKSKNRSTSKDTQEDGQIRDKKPTTRDRSKLSCRNRRQGWRIPPRTANRRFFLRSATETHPNHVRNALPTRSQQSIADGGYGYAISA